jgi:hypothetical protein
LVLEYGAIQLEGALLSRKMVREKEVKPDIDQFVSFFMLEVVGVFNCFDDFLDMM